MVRYRPGMDVNQALAELLKEHQKQAELSDEALALASALPKMTAVRYRDNPADGKLAPLQRMAAALDTSLEDLLREAPERARQSAHAA
jgi:hypothetical protein